MKKKKSVMRMTWESQKKYTKEKGIINGILAVPVTLCAIPVAMWKTRKL